MVVLALISFGTTYWVFSKFMTDIETKSIKTSKPVVVQTTPPGTSNGETIIIGDGQGSPSPDPNAEPTPEPVTPDSESAEETVTVDPTPVPEVTRTPVPLSTLNPVPQAPVPTPARTAPPPVQTAPPVIQEKQTYFKVRVGSYDSRMEAETKSKELQSLGYTGLIIDEPEGSYVQLGTFREQDKALVMAEEISQKGYSVIIRQVEE